MATVSRDRDCASSACLCLVCRHLHVQTSITMEREQTMNHSSPEFTLLTA